MKTKQSTEKYLKAIYELRSFGEVRGVRIAETLKYSKPTVCVALKNLQEEGFLTMDDDHVVTLTTKGEKVAMQVHERHTIFEDLLISLGIDRHTAHADACEMEHTVSDKSFEALKKLAKDLEHGKSAVCSSQESVSYDR